MVLRKISFANDEIYHIVLRSVEGIKIFKGLSDYFRIIYGLYEFNNKKPVSIWQRRKSKRKMLQGQRSEEHTSELQSH